MTTKPYLMNVSGAVSKHSTLVGVVVGHGIVDGSSPICSRPRLVILPRKNECDAQHLPNFRLNYASSSGRSIDLRRLQAGTIHTSAAGVSDLPVEVQGPATQSGCRSEERGNIRLLA